MFDWTTKARWFGWDYVYIRNTACSKICRVKVAPNGERIFQPYSSQVQLISEPLPIDGKVIGGWRTVPLTPNITAT